MCKCKMCGDVYSAEDLRELREMGEEYNRKPFLCPDCFDEFNRMDSEDQMELLLNDFRRAIEMLKEFIFEVDGKRISIKAESLEEAVKELKGKRYYLLTTCPVSTTKK